MGRRKKEKEKKNTEKCRRMSNCPYGLKLLYHWDRRIIWLADE